MGIDGRPRITLWRAVPARAIRTALVAAAVLATGGCPLGEPERAEMTIRNESSAEVNVFVNDSTGPRTDVRAGGERQMGIGGLEGSCIGWLLEARTVEGVAVSTFGPPVCDKDEWVITQDDVDAATAGG